MAEDRFSTSKWPLEIELVRNKKSLNITFDDGKDFNLSAEYLRVHSPSAEVQGHSPSERKLVAGKAEVAIVQIEEIGNYAIRLIFDDQHDTGIYSWQYLYKLGSEFDLNWQDYLDSLEKAGASRHA